MACTTYPLDHLTLIMNKKTFDRRCNQLLQDIMVHPHMHEILDLMSQSIQDEVEIPTKILKDSRL